MLNYKKILGVIFVALAVYLGFLYVRDQEWKYTTLTEAELKEHYTKEYHILTLYQMLKDTDEIFKKNKINYWIDSGTLLGAVRHKGIIPTDDDVDLGILHEQEVKFQLALKDFEDLGYRVRHECIYTIFPKDKKYPFLDIFVYNKLDNNFVFSNLSTRAKYDGYFYKEDELFPLKQYQFGEITVWGANNPTPLLDRYYTDWDKYLVIQKHNLPNQSLAKTKIKLIDEFLIPAKPTGPLKNRVP